jgi:hypothetical protein
VTERNGDETEILLYDYSPIRPTNADVRHTPEEIAGKLKQANVLHSQERSIKT